MFLIMDLLAPSDIRKDFEIEREFMRFISSISPVSLVRKSIDGIINTELNPSLNKNRISVKAKIENILWNIPLVKILLLAKEYWLIEISWNIWNEFFQEKELKIFEIDKASLEKRLISLWATKVFEWRVEDIYYDYWDDCIEWQKWKVSFRVREKIDKDWNLSFFYTIKRKEPEDLDSKILRVCYEEEFRILRLPYFLQLLDHFWFYRSRWKSKDRTSYLPQDNKDIKFDIDTYEFPWWIKIPTLLEIEALETNIALQSVDRLWLKKHDMSNRWSRSVAKRYWLEQFRFARVKK